MRSKGNGRSAQDQRPQQSQQDQDASKPEDDIPACQSCRKKKARCSREQPCSQCVRFDVACVYDDRRLKPGLRAGAVDQLYRRIDTLENMFLGQSVLWKQVWEALHPNSAFPGAADEDGHNEESPGRQFVHAREAIKKSMLQLAETKKTAGSLIEAEHNDDGDFRSSKRRKVDVVSTTQQPVRNGTDFDILNSDIVNDLVEFYFANIHHWIPILHVRIFREQIQTYKGRQKAIYILHAIVALCSRFSDDSRLGNDAEKAELAETSRQKVILSSMESFSVENLQALVIIAFDTLLMSVLIGRGRGPSSWSIVGGMARTVEQLQLSVEEEHLSSHSQSGETLIRRMAFLKPSTSWREAEERRRVFWTVFLMDRFCSVSTGWNISLTSADVKRRLPCEGALWEQENEVKPPYFGISDAKAASPHRPLLTENRMTADPKEQDCIGGFAYCIEATESLALVTNFFLHHALDIRDVDKAQFWLMRFKELDLRMVQWKLFLPPKWRDASVLNADGIMDPNLTLAHTTHNTAVILLHQGIAYPPLHWQSCPVKLPSTSSAETCLEAASEISTIGQQFLLCSPILTNPQFSFCLFIAGRMLLTHSKYYATPIPNSLDSLIDSLFEISRRWAGPQNVHDSQKDNLASGFAKRLVSAKDNLPALSKPSLDIRQTAYSEGTDDRAPSKHVETVSTPTVLERSSVLPSNTYGEPEPPLPIPDNHSDTSVGLAFPPLPLSFQQTLQSFTDVDPFGISLTDRDQFNPQPSHVPIWNNATSPIYTNAPISFGCVSPEHLQTTLSPGQRISRYGAVEVDQAAAMGENSRHLGHSS
ncbi:fungal-specific transcription factor domain-containing protein [Aspergillus pseudotamarii]|uniref:Fungal-specific transcription factor domain-containing protein n=1 Tax=Aspergillus pseudotamarii TaxID=132259 RepID=A0A5N6T3L9_ASPPS|nr:fungal-specific transcription factor domain-containing protein [Aspergillus pseudotamarii]KAE8140801.1 fungal-specific transcription factor domain-containing protein [Aspergillus pseudotamarii]